MIASKHVLASLAFAVTLTLAGAACGGGGSSEASFCGTLEKWQAQEDAIDGSETPGSDGYKESMEKVQKAIKELQAAAPAEIKGDVKTLADMMNAYANLDMGDTEAMMKASENIDQDKAEKASDNITKYASEHCDIDLDE